MAGVPACDPKKKMEKMCGRVRSIVMEKPMIFGAWPSRDWGGV